jgi:hypothetical protein
MAIAAAQVLLHAPIAAQDLEAERRAVRARFAGEVEELAEWAQEHRLYLQRDRLYGALLALEPEHAEARRFLRYRRTKAGWEQQRYSAPQDRGSEFLAEYGTRRAALESAWCAALNGLAERRAAGDGGQSAWLADELLILAPDHAQARSRRGEVQAEEGWILEETSSGRARRAHLLARAAGLRSAEPLPETAAPAVGAVAGWREARLPVARVVAADLGAEALSILALAQGAAALFREVFDEAPLVPDDLTVYVLDGADAKREFLARHGDALVRGLAEEHDSFWLPRSSTLVLCGASREIRRDHAVRQLLQRMLRDSYGLGSEDVWALEGFSLRLGELVTGSPDFVRNAGTPIDPARWKKGEDPWRAARALLAAESRPPLARLFGLRAEDLTREDLLLSYALAGYLIEARPGKLARLLDEIGRGATGTGEPSVGAILEQELGLAPAMVDARLARWAAEMGV